MENIDKEYYVIDDISDDCPSLAWGSTDDSLFVENKKIDPDELKLPLEVEFDSPYPKKYKMNNILMIGLNFVCSKELKEILEKQTIYGIDFYPIKIKDKKNKIIDDFFVINIWNTIPSAIKTYNGKLRHPNSFRLNEEILNKIQLEKRLIFVPEEATVITLFHESIFEIIKNENIKGYIVGEWYEDIRFKK
jgi:hypothetical protein